MPGLLIFIGPTFSFQSALYLFDWFVSAGQSKQYHHDVVPLSGTAGVDAPVDAPSLAATAFPSASNLPAQLRQVNEAANLVFKTNK